jgi:hypothetical protein
MKKPLTVQQIDEKILQLKQQLLALGPFQPGSLSRQYQVCGRPGCQCGHSKKPRPHGPYTKLTYAYHGKFTCRFVRVEAVEAVTAMVATFKKFRQLTDAWIALAIQRARLGPLQRTAPRSKPTKTGPGPQKSSRLRKLGR